MRLVLRLTVLLFFLALSPSSLLRAGDEPAFKKLSPIELARKIDQFISSPITAQKAEAAPLADDAEFVRRVYLDLTGRIPDLLATRDFIDNPARDKRSKLVARLLVEKRYGLHWANVWRNWLLPDTSDQQVQFLAPQIAVWLKQQFDENIAYDKFVRSIITSGDATRGGPLYAFYQANQFKPENLASSTSRLFLGVKLECAQCHNHPHARWKRQQFWEMAAFFSATPNPFGLRGGLVPSTGVPPPVPVAGEIKIPGTDRTVKARYLDGTAPSTTGDIRERLVDWMTRKNNPFFARALVNRYWEYLLGTGLIEPVDEESADNPPSHPELLSLLAEQFAENGYNLKYLLEAIVSTQAYQRTSRQTHRSQADPRLFARMKVRGLSPEQLYDSLALATGHKDEDESYNLALARGFNPASPREDFIRRFPTPDKRTEQTTSILQALYLMNGKIVADATSLEHNQNLAIIAEAKTVRTSRRVQQLFLITLNRKPTEAESGRLVKYVDKGGPTGDSARALCDVFWALLNSSEFCVNR